MSMASAGSGNADDGRRESSGARPLFVLQQPKRGRGRPKKAPLLVDGAYAGAEARNRGMPIGADVGAGSNLTGAQDDGDNALQIMTVDVGNCAMELLRGGGFPPLVQGCCLVHPIAVHLQKAAQNGYIVDSKLDGDYAKLVNLMLASDYHVSSGVTLEKELGLERQTVKAKLSRLAAALLVQNRMDKLKLEQSLVTSLPYGVQLEAYFDFCAYDETPMVSAVKHEVGKVECSRPVGYTSQLALPPHLALLNAVKHGSEVGVTRSTSKLLQLRSGFGMMISVGMPGQTERKLVHFCGNTLAPIQVMSKNNAKILWEILNRCCSVSMAANKFGLKIRSVVTDQGAANSVAERAFMSCRDNPWQLLHVFCDTHRMSLCHTKTLDAILE
eukprot:6480472-Amphidinium_carterae.2